MTITLKVTSAIVVACGLSACGGTGVPVTTTNPQPAERLTFTEIADIAGDVNAGYNAVPITPKSFVPTAGGATYSGAVGGTIGVQGNVTDVAGIMSVDVDFGRNQIGGLMGNFVTRAGDDIDGTLALRNGVLNRRSNSQQVAIFGDVTGNLRSAAGEAISVDARLRNSGFRGNNVEYIGGDIEGDIYVDGVRGDIDLRTQLER